MGVCFEDGRIDGFTRPGLLVVLTCALLTVNLLTVNLLTLDLLTLDQRTTAFANEADPDYNISATEAEGFPAATAVVTTRLDNDGEKLNGYQWGLCHDPKYLSLDDDDVIELDAEDFDFNFSTVEVHDDEDHVTGWTVGLLMNIVIGAAIDPGEYDLYEATYHITDEAAPDEEGIDVPLEWCDTLGIPKITTLVVVRGAAVTPTLEDGNVRIVPYPAAFEYALTEGVLEYRTDTGENDEPAITVFSIKEIPDLLPDYPTETNGFQCAIGHDESFITVSEIETRTALSDLNDGAGPSFLETDVDPENGPGVTVAVVYSLTFSDTGVLVFEDETDLLEIAYDGVPENLVGNSDSDSSTSLAWRDDLGRPAVANEVVLDGLRLPVETTDASLILRPIFVPMFIRGDCNDDATVNLADGIWILDYLYRAGPEASCREACDVNDDGFRDQSDAIYVLNYRFLTGIEMPDPFPLCGHVNEDEVPDCDIQESCL